MVWTDEEKRQYNKDYYTKNKEVIIKKGCQALNCEACGRKISFNGYNRHLNTKLCINTQDKNKRIKERLQA